MSLAEFVVYIVLAGELLRSGRTPRAKVLWLPLAGGGCIVLGPIWNAWFPIIKHIWTRSFVLYSGGMSLVLLAVFYLVIDVWQFKRRFFGFVVIGMNAIAIYMAVELFNFHHIGNIFVKGLARWTGEWNVFLQDVTAFAVIWLILYWMYRKSSFIKISIVTLGREGSG